MLNKNYFSENTNVNIGLLIFRVAIGAFMLIGHGWGKLMKVFQGNFEFGDPLGIGAAPSLILTSFAEAICSVLIIIGLKTKWATIPLIVAMLVAYLLVHFSDPFGRQEKALMYLVSYLLIFLLGPGKYSLDFNLRPKS